MGCIFSFVVHFPSNNFYFTDDVDFFLNVLQFKNSDFCVLTHKIILNNVKIHPSY
jgi:hypothetical protein